MCFLRAGQRHADCDLLPESPPDATPGQGHRQAPPSLMPIIDHTAPLLFRGQTHKPFPYWGGPSPWALSPTSAAPRLAEPRTLCGLLTPSPAPALLRELGARPGSPCSRPRREAPAASGRPAWVLLLLLGPRPVASAPASLCTRRRPSAQTPESQRVTRPPVPRRAGSGHGGRTAERTRVRGNGALSTGSWSVPPACLLQPHSLGAASLFKARDVLSVRRRPSLFLPRHPSVLQAHVHLPVPRLLVSNRHLPPTSPTTNVCDAPPPPYMLLPEPPHLR